MKMIFYTILITIGVVLGLRYKDQLTNFVKWVAGDEVSEKLKGTLNGYSAPQNPQNVPTQQPNATQQNPYQ